MGQLKDITMKLVDDYKIKSSNENGQNFLVDEEVLAREINQAELKPSDVVLDIGAGFGSIESIVSKKCRIIAIEKEIKCYSYLLDKYEIDPNVQLINADAMEVIYPKFNKIIANPPYSITDKIIDKLSFYDFELGVMILPNTIAKQLLSKIAETRFSAVQKIFFKFEEVGEVKNDSFYPAPRVTSRMIKIIKKANDIKQEIFRRREMLLKNATINGFIALNYKTKREGKLAFEDLPNRIKSLGNRQVKDLTLNEVMEVIKYVK
ncbi:MAG: methyltransferase [Candidatus Parvarchaeota archaeon]|jgi:16S rRNA (adenine1518-N6/adenine1519-N6)-dimethyltransferase|nr:methyltransferase [Candidatus Parvarchaeota archaeon]MCL5106575.1 methyltransferase [Candidatus Parvarchaeota archaeon]